MTRSEGVSPPVVGAGVALVVAVADNGVIGSHGGIPWRLSSDLRRFRLLTMGKPVIMGRRTWDSLPKRPLAERDNIVVTRDGGFNAPGAHVVHDFDQALALAGQLAAARGANEIAVIGGAEIFGLALPKADRIYLSRVHARPEGDVLWPELDPAEWREVHAEELPAGPRDEFAHTYVVLQRRGRGSSLQGQWRD